MRRKISKVLASSMLPGQKVPNMDISGLALHSKDIRKGYAFIAIEGKNSNGNNYINEAIESGASLIISSRNNLGQLPIPKLIVKDSRKAASIIAAEYYGHPSKYLTVIGITGTNGKTTTASIIKSILCDAGYKVAQIGTLGLITNKNNDSISLTTPDAITLQKIFSKLKADKFTHVVMEVSSHALDQYRVADIEFNIGVFTNLSPEHLDYHKTMQCYFESKLRLFSMLPNKSYSVINCSDPYGKKIAKKINNKMISFLGMEQDSIRFKNISLTVSGIRGKITSKKNEYYIKSNLLGSFNSENILAGVSVCDTLGIDRENIEEGIRKASKIPGRMEYFLLNSGAIAIIDYAHTPDAYNKVLNTLKNLILNDGHLYVVFGAGGDRDNNKRPIMAEIAEKYASHCFVTPDNPRTEKLETINKAIASGFKENCFTIFSDRAEGIESAFKIARKNDLIAILGKGREKFQEINNKKINYSDLAIIRKHQ